MTAPRPLSRLEIRLLRNVDNRLRRRGSHLHVGQVGLALSAGTASGSRTLAAAIALTFSIIATFSAIAVASVDTEPLWPRWVLFLEISGIVLGTGILYYCLLFLTSRLQSVDEAVLEIERSAIDDQRVLAQLSRRGRTRAALPSLTEKWTRPPRRGQEPVA